MNKKILLSGGIIAFVTAVALGATYAAWQASDTITGNTVSTAEIGINAVGVASGARVAAPIVFDGALPGDISDPVNRAIVTNDSSVALDLYMYRIPSGTCSATKVAWTSGVDGTGTFDHGYALTNHPTLNPPSVVGPKAGPGDNNFALVGSSIDGATAVKIADSSKFVPGESIAVWMIAGLADDAEYGVDSGICEWTDVFVGTLPGETPTTI